MKLVVAAISIKLVTGRGSIRSGNDVAVESLEIAHESLKRTL